MKIVLVVITLISASAIAESIKGIHYLDVPSVSSSASICATTFTPLPIVVATLRDFGVTSTHSERVLVTVDAEYWSEKERSIPTKIASFFSNTIDKPDGHSPLFSQYRTISPIPLSTRYFPGMSVADAGIGRPTKQDQNRVFEPYYKQINYYKQGTTYHIEYMPKAQASVYLSNAIRQPDDIIWLPGRAIKKLTIKVADLKSPAAPPEYTGKPQASATFMWTAKSGYNPNSTIPPILELNNVTMSGFEDNKQKYGFDLGSDSYRNTTFLGNATAMVSITLGEKYTLDLDWNRIPIIRDLATNTLYSRYYLSERNTFSGTNHNFHLLFDAMKNNKKLNQYDLNLKKIDFIYTNFDLLEEGLGYGHGNSYKRTYFRGSINAYNNVYIDEEQYRKNGAILNSCG